MINKKTIENYDDKTLKKEYYEYKELVEISQCFSVNDLKYYALLENEMADRGLLE